MAKIMLVVDNKEDQNFLEKVLKRLKYTVIAMREGVDLSEQLIDHFPDVVFASTLGKNTKILSALGQIKKVRGKPKLVFVKQEKESSQLSPEQKSIIDGVLYSPVDPFKLIDLLSSTTEVDIKELRKRYNVGLEMDKKTKESTDIVLEDDNKPTNHQIIKGKAGTRNKIDYGATQIMGGADKNAKQQIDQDGSEFGDVNLKKSKNQTQEQKLKQTQEAAEQASHLSGQNKGNKHSHVQGDAGTSQSKATHVGGEWEDPHKDKNRKISQEELEEYSKKVRKARAEAAASEQAKANKQQDAEVYQKPQQEVKAGGASEENSVKSSSPQPQASNSGLINDPIRKKKYDEIASQLKQNTKVEPKMMDADRLRQLQKDQANELEESNEIRSNRKHFLKTLFSMPVSKKNKSS